MHRIVQRLHKHKPWMHKEDWQMETVDTPVDWLHSELGKNRLRFDKAANYVWLPALSVFHSSGVWHPHSTTLQSVFHQRLDQPAMFLSR